MFPSTHPVQFGAALVLTLLNVVALALVNRLKARGHTARWSWSSRRLAYWSCIGLFVLSAMWLDAHFPVDEVFLSIKAYVFAFPLGILDLYFSDTRGVPMMTIVGAALWCSSSVLKTLWVRASIAEDLTMIVTDVSVLSIAKELLRYVVGLPIVGMLSDLLFSPMHRLLHHPLTYKHIHKTHHEYTNKLTSLVLYHAQILDDFLMPVTTTCGGIAFVKLASLFGLEGSVSSNMALYLITFNINLSHAHDIRCARLMAPLPDSLNFIAYHYTHHLRPDKNFGLTKPSDLIWDRILGQDTISEPSAETLSGKDE